tara:strand:+ start:1495 stop:1809 length:315 start_codon:yes stop_codon:yes gene_type:complete
MSKIARKAKVLSRMKWLVEYKTNKPCADCGKIFDPVCMDFHHREPHLKVDGIRELLRDGYSMEKVMIEIKKCDILCACCHRLRHKNEPVLKVASRTKSKAVLPL